LEKIRRKDRILSEDKGLALLLRAEYGVLSISSAENIPYGVPLNFCLIGSTIYFHCAKEGKKLDYIMQNSSASFCVVGKTQLLPEEFGTIYESVIVTGKAEESFDEEKQMALEGLLLKYSSQYVESGKKYISKLWDQTRVFKIFIEDLSVKGRLNI
jgi:nitroimidazol reductase NimA-like FMN-containing flavoprotein (pyridoxamine 5'-phosphate oxidase superfamily)